jgi:MoaA/NifB/PqqE/SkfB family radical SAM enzyme
VSDENQITKHLENTLKHLYINPLEKCNLACKICYTQKTKFVLSNQEIIDFIERYQQAQELQSVTFCGGEVFLLKDFTQLINQLTNKNIFVQIISNGTIDRLDEIEQVNMVNLIISLDGLENYHDQNRGQGNFKKSINFLKKASKLGFHTEIFSIVTKENFAEIPQFEKEISNLLGKEIEITYHPRKPITYLKNHPISNVLGQVKNFNFLDLEEVKQLMKKRQTFPPQNLGCYQVSLMSDKKVYACCEGIHPIGDINTDAKELIDNLEERLEKWNHKKCQRGCLGCSEPDFVCGFKDLFSK